MIDDGTVLKISVPITDDDYETPRTKTYTYSALFVNKRWYLTGHNRLLNAEYATTVELLTAIARYPGTTIELATEFETIR